MNKYLNIALIAIIALLTACSATQEQTEKTELPTDTNAMPELRFDRLDGTSFQLSELKGKRVFLSFWATWCKPCIQEMPSIAAVQKEMGDNMVFLLVSDETKEQIAQFAERKGYDLNFVKAGFSLDQLEITGLPTNIIINEKGEQENFLVGSRDWHSEEGQAIIKGTMQALK